MRTHRRERPGDARISTRRSGRQRPETELLYGRNAVLEALRAGRRRFIQLTVAEGLDSRHRLAEIEELARQHGARIQYAPRDRLDGLVRGNHQGVVLEATPYAYAEDVDLTALAAERAVLLALDGLVDPQNLGTLLRTAEATGVALVVIPSDRSARVTPAVVNASSGAVEHLRIARETNLARWLDRARAAGFWAVGLASDDAADELFNVEMSPPIVLVVGSEGEGLRRLVREHCDILVSIPMRGRIASLNAAVAGSIGLYEVVRDSADSLNE